MDRDTRMGFEENCKLKQENSNSPLYSWYIAFVCCKYADTYEELSLCDKLTRLE